MLLDGLFASGSPVPLSDLKNTFAATLASVKGSMYDEVVRRGWFRRSPQSQRASWSGLGMLLIFLGAICAFFLGQSIPTGSPISGVPLSGTTILGAGLAVSGVIVNVLAQRMASRTADGTAMLAQSLGFKKYLVTAEANQIKFEEAQQIFSAYLPYAIVFGVADKWANTFDEVAAAAAAAGVTMASPVWYIGPNFGQGGFFDSIASGADSFVGELGVFWWWRRILRWRGLRVIRRDLVGLVPTTRDPLGSATGLSCGFRARRRRLGPRRAPGRYGVGAQRPSMSLSAAASAGVTLRS